MSDDALTVTFTLRDGLTYSDGAPVTAADFVYGWTRLCDPNVAGDYAFVGYVIAGCERWNNLDPKRASSSELDAAKRAVGVAAPDTTHVVFTLTRPAPYFLRLPPSGSAYPRAQPMSPPAVTSGRSHRPSSETVRSR